MLDLQFCSLFTDVKQAARHLSCSTSLAEFLPSPSKHSLAKMLVSRVWHGYRKIGYSATQPDKVNRAIPSEERS